MIRRTSLLGLVALAAAAAASGAAEAGSGVRLNFGGPLPSFVATPTPGYGSPRSGGYVTHPAHCARKSAKGPAVHHAARRPADEDRKSRTHIAEKTSSKPVRQVAAYDDKPAKRQVERQVANPKPVVLAKADVAEIEVAKTSVTSTGPSAARSLASTALPPSEPLAAKAPDTTLAAVAAPEAIVAETADTVPGTTATTTAATSTKPAQVAEASGPQNCKKFIPAVGVTITVGCAK